MKTLSTWLLLLLLAGKVPAQLQVVPEHRPQALLGGINQNIAVQLRNIGGQAVESELRLVLLQTSMATAVRSGALPWKKLLVLPGQTVLESATVPFPAVRAETRFLLQWIEGRSNVIGVTELIVYPTNLLTELQSLAGGVALGVFDPADELKPLLRGLKIEFQDLQVSGTDKFAGRLAIFGPFAAKSQMRAERREDIRAVAKRGAAVVWLLPPLKDEARLKPSFYPVREGEGTVLVAAGDLVAQLAVRPEAQLNLVRLAREALHPTLLELPETETSN